MKIISIFEIDVKASVKIDKGKSWVIKIVGLYVKVDTKWKFDSK